MWPWEITICGRSQNCERALRAIRELPDREESIPLGWAIVHKHASEAMRETMWMVIWCLVSIHAVLTWCWWVLEL